MIATGWIPTLLQSTRSFCTNLPLFVVSLLQSNESCHFVKDIMVTRREMIRGRRCREGGEMLARLIRQVPIFRSKSSPQKSGGNPHHVTTHKSASAGDCGHNASTTHVNQNVRVAMCATADQRLSQHLTALRKDGQ